MLLQIEIKLFSFFHCALSKIKQLLSSAAAGLAYVSRTPRRVQYDKMFPEDSFAVEDTPIHHPHQVQQQTDYRDDQIRSLLERNAALETKYNNLHHRFVYQQKIFEQKSGEIMDDMETLDSLLMSVIDAKCLMIGRQDSLRKKKERVKIVVQKMLEDGFIHSRDGRRLTWPAKNIFSEERREVEGVILLRETGSRESRNGCNVGLFRCWIDLLKRLKLEIHPKSFSPTMIQMKLNPQRLYIGYRCLVSC